MNENELIYYYNQNPTQLFPTMLKYYDKLIYGAIHATCFNFDQLRFSVEDCYQEAMLTMIQALRCYREDIGSPFSSYLYKSITRAVRVLARKHRSLSFGLLDRSLSLEYPIGQEGGLMLMDMMVQEKSWYQPEAMIHYHETLLEVREVIEGLSFSEKRVFSLRNQGMSYGDIAQKTQVSSKKVDNILQKIRRKVKERMD